MNRQQQIKLKNNQQGLVSIIVTLIIMLILSLIVIGFANLSRREQRQALDRQLSTQAYYAAETGINDATDFISGLPPNSSFFNDDYTKDCLGGDSFIDKARAAGATLDPDGNVESSGNVKYSCLFVDPSPPTLEYGNIDTTFSKVIPIEDRLGANITDITISWQDKDGGTTLGCSHPLLPPESSWGCSTGIMRVDLVPTNGSLSRDSLINNTRTVFLYPSGSGSTSGSHQPGFGTTKQGQVVRVRCGPGFTPKHCTYKITSLGATSYVMRIKSIYKASAVTISANGGAAQLSGAQALVDSTGKAADVLRRIQVRVPISNFNATFPEFAVSATDNLCKKFEVAPPNTFTDYC